MKATGGPQKLRFSVVSFTGEDQDYPVSELLFHSPQTRGWQTARFCTYPQEVVLKLEQPSKIQQIQILSHEYKIATRVEVFVALPGPGEGPNTTQFKRLGYLSFDSNERSSHQARELKSVHVSVHALFIRLVIHRCHVNKLNIYNQAGIIALNLIGEPVRTAPVMPPGGYLQLHPPVSKDVHYYNQAAADVADLNLDIHVDTVTAAKIRELARAKDAAVAAEDYDEAKRLKASIDRLKVLGQKIAQLEARKRAAVEKEDYDTAKLIKADIDKLRSAGDTAAIASDQFAPRPNKTANDVMTRVLKTSQPQVPLDDQPVRGVAAEPSLNQEPSAVTVEDVQEPAAAAMSAMYSYDEDGLAPEPSYQRHSGGYNKHLAYDERPAQGKGRYTPSEEAMAAAATMSGVRGAPEQSDIPAPAGWPADLPPPEPLTAATSKEAGPIEELAGEFCARAAYSKNWQLREAAVTWLMGQVKDGAFSDRNGAFRALVGLIKRGMKDKVANVYLACLGAFQQLIDGFAASVGPRDIQSACEGCLPLLLEKLGDANTRLRDASRESILFIAGLREAGGLRSYTHVLVKPIKNPNAAKLILGVLSILQELVPVIGIGKAGHEGFDLGELMEFVGKAYNNSNADVRSCAVKVTREVHALVGAALRKHLPKDINPKIKEQVDAILGADAAPPPPAPAPAAAPARAARAAPHGATAHVTAAKTPAGKPKPASAKPRPAAQAAAVPAPAIPANPDDPRPFEEELKQREATLGPAHPDVAESCSNLATLYNQKGDSGRAMPLYERALGIYEAHYGPEHPEVAHTLTDLAVLHLEQGNDAVGRPLLERALAIQEKALGPDHPDVLAIKDVLNSE